MCKHRQPVLQDSGEAEVRKKRGNSPIKVDMILLTEIEDILEAWADHFENLAILTPKDNEHGAQIEKDLAVIHNIAKRSIKVSIPVIFVQNTPFITYISYSCAAYYDLAVLLIESPWPKRRPSHVICGSTNKWEYVQMIW